jgi:hypothetical protein
MSVASTRRLLYTINRALGDYQAVRRGRVRQRIENRLIGRLVGRLTRGLWRR